MKVAFVSRVTLFSGPGGDTMQMQKTAEFLAKIGVHVDIYTSDQVINYKDYDLLHGFNAIRPADLLTHFSQCGKMPVALSPIYVDYSEFDSAGRSGFSGKVLSVSGRNGAEYIKTMMRWVKNKERNFNWAYLIRGHKYSVKRLLNRADILLPNSNSEYERLSNDYAINRQFVVIPNAIDRSIFRKEIDITGKEKDLVICVARIDSQKNQLNLVRAINVTNLRLVVIGKAAPNHLAYYEQCRAEAGPNITFLSHMPQDRVVEYYRKAAVHAMPSWFETTGLSSLEAAAMGCRVVMSPNGDAPEYFGDHAEYCDPSNVESIRAAVLTAASKDLNEGFREKIYSDYIWEKTAEKTLRAYELSLKMRKG